MTKLSKSIFSPPSVRLDLLAVCGVVLLLSVSLIVMFFFSRRAIQRETRLYAEQTLEGNVKHVDNILLSVEQFTSNIYREMENHLDQPERMEHYCRRMVEFNPYVSGCAICFRPGYYPGRNLFMTYVYCKGGVKAPNVPLVTSDKFGNKPYTEYEWYREPMTTGNAFWTNPQMQEEGKGEVLSFCLPIVDGNKERVGVFVADLSVEHLSKLILAENATPNSYSVLLGSNGSYIVHPDQKSRINQTVFSLTEGGKNPELNEIAQSMMAGESGSGPFELNGKDWYAFYKPFQQTQLTNRAMAKLNWSIAVVYSEDDIFAPYYYMLLSVVVISILGLLVFYLLVRYFTRRQMKPVQQLTYATKRIAEGYYDEPMPDINRNDEIGLLYGRFQVMRQSLAARVNELKNLTGTLKKRHEVMHEIYSKEKSVDRMKTALLHHVTNQMIAPSDEIERCVKILHSKLGELSPREVGYVVDTINSKSDTIVELMNNLLDTADTEVRKEDNHG